MKWNDYSEFCVQNADLVRAILVHAEKYSYVKIDSLRDTTHSLTLRSWVTDHLERIVVPPFYSIDPERTAGLQIWSSSYVYISIWFHMENESSYSHYEIVPETVPFHLENCDYGMLFNHTQEICQQSGVHLDAIVQQRRRIVNGKGWIDTFHINRVPAPFNRVGMTTPDLEDFSDEE